MRPVHQRDLHRFVWRKNPQEPIKDFSMTGLTYGISASSFAMNMAMKYNAIQHIPSCPWASQTVLESFYVDNGLMSADLIQNTIDLRHELQDLFQEKRFHAQEMEKYREGCAESYSPSLN